MLSALGSALVAVASSHGVFALGEQAGPLRPPHLAQMAGWAWVTVVFVLLSSPAGAQEVDGEQQYLEQCSGCHGPDGTGTEWGPPIVEDGEAGNHFWMATGRMPIRRPDERIEPRDPVLTEEQIDAITSHVATLGEGIETPPLDLSAGRLNEGSVLYISHCAACHGTSGVGGAIVQARNATSILQIRPLLIAEAIRSGPGAMPIFGEETLSDEELNSVVRYVTFLQDSAALGGWELGRWGPVAEGAAAWILGIGAAVIAAYWTERLGQHDHLERS